MKVLDDFSFSLGFCKIKSILVEALGLFIFLFVFSISVFP